VRKSLRDRLADPSDEVLNRTIAALGLLQDRVAIPALIAAADSEQTRFEATQTLAAMPDITALQVYLRALSDKSPDLRKAAATAIGNLRDRAAPVLEQLSKRNELSPAVLPELQAIFSGLEPVKAWKVLGPVPIQAPPTLAADRPIDLTATYDGAGGKRIAWQPAQLADPTGQVDLGQIYSHDDDLAAYGYAEIKSNVDRSARLVVGSDDTLTVWLNGKQVYDFSDRRGFDHDQAHFDVSLHRGTNQVLIRCGNRGGPWQFSVAVTGSPDYAFLKGPSAPGFNPELYRAEALKGKGKPDRGRALFADLKGLACTKCHAVGKQGGTVGPELSSVGAKYPRDELIAAVLYPSAKISSGYEPTIFAFADGRVLTGILKTETGDAVEIQDSDAKLVRIPKADIEDRKRSDVSIMPRGLAQGISPRDFADLIGYLETLKEVQTTGTK
jgi:putative heme-binding domain-containing protein